MSLSLAVAIMARWPPYRILARLSPRPTATGLPRLQRGWRPQPTQGWRMIEGMRGGYYCNLLPARMRCGAGSSLVEGTK